MLIPFEKLPMGKVNGIIHVGAHEAEELPGYLLSGVRKIAWIEANPGKAELLNKKISKYPEMVVGNFAAGASNGSTLFNIANNGQSSSVLPLGTHEKLHPDVYFTNQVEVEIRRIDDWMTSQKLDRHSFNFITLDIQGYEIMALKGAVKQLGFVDFIVSEISNTELYAGGAVAEQLDEFLADFGFERILTAMTPQGWGDAFYFKVSP